MVKRGEANLLAGRALRLKMHPFSASLELGERFDLQRALQTGPATRRRVEVQVQIHAESGPEIRHSIGP